MTERDPVEIMAQAMAGDKFALLDRPHIELLALTAIRALESSGFVIVDTRNVTEEMAQAAFDLPYSACDCSLMASCYVDGIREAGFAIVPSADNARLRGLLERAGKALTPFTKTRYAHVRQFLSHDDFVAARALVAEIEDELK